MVSIWNLKSQHFVVEKAKNIWFTNRVITGVVCDLWFHNSPNRFSWFLLRKRMVLPRKYCKYSEMALLDGSHMGISSNLWLKLEDLLPESSTHQRSVPDSHLLLRYLSSFQCRQQDLGPGLKKVPVLKNAPQKLSGSAASDDRMFCPKRLAFIPAIETRGWTKYAQLYRLFSSTLGVDIKHIALLLWFLSISWFRWYDIYKKTWKCTYTNKYTL